MSKKAVIFGITGQDGSYLVELLIEKGYDITGVTRRVSTGNTGRIAHLLDHSQVKLVEGDITDYSSILRIVEENEPDEVYNLAAMSHVGTSFNQPLLSMEVTGKGCLNILEVLREHSPLTRFYQASSSEMFGDSITYDAQQPEWNIFHKPGSNNGYQDEDTPFNPQSPYAVAKLSAHHLTGLYRNAYDLYACCGILFNHESERRGGRFVTKKITKYIAQLHKYFVSSGPVDKAPILTLGNLDAKRDWGHAKDYVEAMWLMLQQDVPDDYVIATGETYSVRDFLTEAFSLIWIDDFSPFVKQDPKFMRPSDVPYLRGDASKARDGLGWTPKTGFKELVKTMVEYDIARL